MGVNIKNIENVKVMNKCNSNAGILVKKERLNNGKIIKMKSKT